MHCHYPKQRARVHPWATKAKEAHHPHSHHQGFQTVYSATQAKHHLSQTVYCPTQATPVLGNTGGGFPGITGVLIPLCVAIPGRPAEREMGVDTPRELVSVCGMKLGGRGPLRTTGELGTAGAPLASPRMGRIGVWCCCCCRGWWYCCCWCCCWCWWC